jgi:hypothetical protein
MTNKDFNQSIKGVLMTEKKQISRNNIEQLKQIVKESKRENDYTKKSISTKMINIVGPNKWSNADLTSTGQSQT